MNSDAFLDSKSADDFLDDKKSSETLPAKDMLEYAKKVGKSALGVGETAASMVAGIPAQVAGGLYGLGTLASGQGLEKAASAVDRIQQNNFGFGAYEPTTETGKTGAKNLQAAFMYPGEKAGELGGYIGEKLGNRALGELSAKLPVDVAMNFLPIHGIGKGIKGTLERAGKPGEAPSPGAALDARLEAVKPATSAEAFLDQGAELGRLKQIDAEQVARLEAAIAKQNPEQTPISVNARGEAIATPDQAQLDFFRRAAEEKTAAARAAEAPPEVLRAQQATPFNVDPITGLPVDMEAMAQSVANIERNQLPPDAVIPRDSMRDQYGNPMLRVPREGEWIKDENGIPVRTGLPESTVAPDYINRYMRQDEAARNDLGNAIQEANGPLLGAAEPFGAGRLNTGAASGQRGAVSFDQLAEQAKKVYTKYQEGVESLGRININTLAGSNKQDYAQAIPGMGRSLEGLIPRPQSPEVMIPKILAEGKDGPPLWKSMQSGLEITGEKVNSLLMKSVSQWLQYPAKKADYAYQSQVKPLERQLSRLKDSTTELATILKKEMFNRERYTPEQLREAGVKENVIKAYTELRKQFDDVLNLQNEGRAKLGMQPISAEKAYLASIRDGEYHIVLRDTEGKLVYASQFQSVWQGRKEINWFKDRAAKLGIDPSSLVVQHRASNVATNVPKDVLGAFQELSNLIDEGSDASLAIKEAIRSANENAGYNLYNQKNRFLAKGNVRGFEGDMPWLSEKENATKLLNAQVSYLQNAHKWSYMQDALGNIKQLMADENIIKQQPNNMAMVKEVMNHQLGLTKALTKDAEDFAMRSLGLSRAQLRSGVFGMKSFTYLQQLGLSVGYMAATPITALNAVGLALRERGIGALSPTVIGKTFIDGFGGIVGDLSYEFGSGTTAPPMTELGKAALTYAEANGVVSKNVFNEGHAIGENPVSGTIKNTLGSTISIPEKTQRMFTFMAFAHHLNEMGTYKSLPDLFQRAEELTNMAATNFRGSERPTIVSKLGSLGELGYTYKAPLFNYFHQLSMFGRDAVDGLKAGQPSKALPLGGMLAMTSFLGGALAFPLVDEMDGAFNVVKSAWANIWPESYDKVSGLGLKGNMIASLPTTAAYGAVSTALDAQMSSRFAPNMIDVEHPLSGVAPVAQELNEQMAIGKFALNPSYNNFVQGVHVNMPPLVKGLMETNMDAFKGPKTSQGQVYFKPSDIGSKTADVVRNPHQEMIRSLGLRQLDETKMKDLRYINNAEQQRVTTAVNGNVDKLFENLIDKDPAGARPYAAALLRLNPDSQTLNSALDKKLEAYAFTPEQRDIMKTDAIKTLMKVKRLKDAVK